ncbi:nucleotidyltransferase domain-containing protein [candidate division WOR-3 bacterium]|nr:nucleotidyltransferase domain-containing protein [candidate division WOR-3 bacterium]
MGKKEVNQIIQRYLKILEEHRIRVKSAYLFGSYIKGTFSKYSDIDLAIISDDFTKDSIKAQLLLMKLRRKVDISIEPHPFLSKNFVSDNPFAMEIIKTGKKVK